HCPSGTSRQAVGEDGVAEDREVGVVMPLVSVALVVARAGLSVGKLILEVDRARWTDVGLATCAASGACVWVDVEDGGAEQAGALRIGLVFVSDFGAASDYLGEPRVVGGVELVDAVNGAHVDTGLFVRIDAGLRDDGDAGHRALRWRVIGGIP